MFVEVEVIGEQGHTEEGVALREVVLSGVIIRERENSCEGA